MRKLISSSIAAAMLATSMVAVTPALAQGRDRDQFIEQFYLKHGRDDDYWRWKRGGWRDDDYHGWYYRHDDDFGGNAAAAIFGLAAGAVAGAIVSGATQGAANYDVVGGDQWDYQCSLKYNSYDPARGTFLGYDGYRHPCVLP